MEDNLYDTFAKIRAKSLARSMAATKQTKAAAIFNNGFTSGLGGDGVVLFSASHPVQAGVQSNLLTAADLSESSLETAVIQIQKAEDDRGILIGAMPVSLHIAPDNQFVAQKILKSTLSTTTVVYGNNLAGVAGNVAGVTNTNDINAVRSMGVVPQGDFVNHRFTAAGAWFVKSDVPNGTKMFVRAPLGTKMEPDFDTGNLRFKARERYSFGWSDWRGFYGNAG
jgi:hypothetical protein